MADGVKIRIVGDDSEFVKTLENLEKRTRSAFRGVDSQLPSLTGGLRSVIGGLSARLNAVLPAADVSEGLLAQKPQVQKAAGELASAAQEALASATGAYGAGAQMAEGFCRGLAGRKQSIIAAAGDMAGAAVGAMRSRLEIRSPSRVTMQMGEYAGQGFEIGLTRSLQSAVRSAGRTAGELNLAPRMSGNAAGAVQQQAWQMPAQPLYLNVDGHTLAQVITGEMHRSLNGRSRSIDAGLGR